MEESAESVYNQTHDPSGLVWVAHTGTDAVPDAVYAGKEANDRQVFVARALHYKCLFSGKFVPGLGMYFPYGGEENKAPTFQVLTNPSNDAVQTKWALFEGRIPPTAVKGGFFPTGSPNKWEYIGRTKHNGQTVLGYVSKMPSPDAFNLCYFIDGDDHYVYDFEILLAKNRHDTQCIMNFQLNCCASCPKKKL